MGRKFTYAIGNIVVRGASVLDLRPFGEPVGNDLTTHSHPPPNRLPKTSPTPQWDAAVAMHHYFQDQAEFPLGCFQGKAVLELGSGTGLGAFCVLRFGFWVWVWVRRLGWGR